MTGSAVINKQTGIAVGVVLPMASIIFAAGLWFGGKGDDWTLSMESEAALRLAMANPGLSVPDPRNPGQYFQVTGVVTERSP